MSFLILSMVIIGGLGSLIGLVFWVRPSSVEPADPPARGVGAGRRSPWMPPPWSTWQFMVVGAMIIFFLIVEPAGLRAIMADHETETATSGLSPIRDAAGRVLRLIENQGVSLFQKGSVRVFAKISV